ncbi:hypothetical protein BH20ACT2_BH20ACT2_21070 [soil metagenome]
MPRILAAFALAALTVGLGLGAVGANDVPEAAADADLGRVSTPVLSARRVPAIVAAPVAERRLVLGLLDIVNRSAEGTCLTVDAAGAEIFSHQPDLSVVPASTEKLATAVAALEVLGPETRFRTGVVAAAPPAGGVVTGDLWMVGAGDPLLATDDYLARFRRQPQIHTDLEALADAVAAAGVRQVQGRIVGDETRFDGARYVPSWPPRYIDQNQTGPLSALSVNDSFTAFPPTPDSGGEETAAPDPPVHAAAVLSFLLEARGITFGAPPAAGPRPADVVEVAGVDSPPVREIVAQMLRESDNTTAELLLKQLGVVTGGGGSTVAGAAAVTAVLTEEGLPMQGVQVVDGSGLDLGNRTTCAFLTDLLADRGDESLLAAGLPVAGRTGTLELRFLDTIAEGRLRAKTGTLRDVSALAGFVDSLGGADLTFAFVVNADLVNAAALQDQLADRLVRFPDVPPFDQLGPTPADRPG